MKIKGIKPSAWFSPLIKLGNTLSDIPVIIWITAYGVVIIVFAILYSLSPIGLYHTNSTREVPFYEAGVEISDRIKTSIKESLKEYRQKPFDPNTTAWSVVDDSIKVSIIGSRADCINFNIGLYAIHLRSLKHIKGEKKSQATQYFTKVKAKLINEKIKILDDVYYTVEIIDNKDIFDLTPDIESLNYGCLFYQDFLGEVSALKFNEETETVITEYLSASEGYPYGIDGGFPRMLYFSAVTITTLGYGDIVPISGYTRLLTGVEATLGVLLLGLMLNSIKGQKN